MALTLVMRHLRKVSLSAQRIKLETSRSLRWEELARHSWDWRSDRRAQTVTCVAA